MRLVFWGAVGLGVALVLQRGVGTTVSDLGGWLAWGWSEWERMAAEGGPQKGRGAGKSYGSSYGGGGRRSGQGRRNWS